LTDFEKAIAQGNRIKNRQLTQQGFQFFYAVALGDRLLNTCAELKT